MKDLNIESYAKQKEAEAKAAKLGADAERSALEKELTAAIDSRVYADSATEIKRAVDEVMAQPPEVRAAMKTVILRAYGSKASQAPTYSLPGAPAGPVQPTARAKPAGKPGALVEEDVRKIVDEYNERSANFSSGTYLNVPAEEAVKLIMKQPTLLPKLKPL